MDRPSVQAGDQNVCHGAQRENGVEVSSANLQSLTMARGLPWDRRSPMRIVRLGLRRPYTFVVVSLLIAVPGALRYREMWDRPSIAALRPSR